MEENNSKVLYYDYYSETTNYVKTIIDLLPVDEVSDEMRYIIKTIYNYAMDNASSDRKFTVSKISEAFLGQVELNKELATKYAQFAYYFFIKRMVFESERRDELIGGLGESVKMFLEYFPSLQIGIGENSSTRGNLSYR